MKQVLLSLFFVLILGFSIAGYTQTLDDDGDMVEKDNQTVITDKT